MQRCWAKDAASRPEFGAIYAVLRGECIFNLLPLRLHLPFLLATFHPLRVISQLCALDFARTMHAYYFHHLLQPTSTHLPSDNHLSVTYLSPLTLRQVSLPQRIALRVRQGRGQQAHILTLTMTRWVGQLHLLTFITFHLPRPDRESTASHRKGSDLYFAFHYTYLALHPDEGRGAK